jgi:hypothetical protein
MPQVSDLRNRRICLHIARIKLSEQLGVTLKDVSFTIIQCLKIDLDYIIMIAIGALFGGASIVIGYHAEPVFYSQAIIIFSMVAFLMIRDIRF